MCTVFPYTFFVLTKLKGFALCFWTKINRLTVAFNVYVPQIPRKIIKNPWLIIRMCTVRRKTYEEKSYFATGSVYFFITGQILVWFFFFPHLKIVSNGKVGKCSDVRNDFIFFFLLQGVLFTVGQSITVHLIHSVIRFETKRSDYGSVLQF